jgi:hypothetical protein
MPRRACRKITAIEITGPVKRGYKNTLHGLDTLPVELTTA